MENIKIDFKLEEFLKAHARIKNLEGNPFGSGIGRNYYQELLDVYNEVVITRQISKVNSFQGLKNVIKQVNYLKINNEFVPSAKIIKMVETAKISDLPTEYGIRNAVVLLVTQNRFSK
jgi:hypothetical protein